MKKHSILRVMHVHEPQTAVELIVLSETTETRVDALFAPTPRTRADLFDECDRFYVVLSREHYHGTDWHVTLPSDGVQDDV